MLGAGAAAGAGTAAECPALPRKRQCHYVQCVESLDLPVQLEPQHGLRAAEVLPFKTRPSFNSKVSAAAVPTKNRASATADMKRFALFIVPSHDWKSGIPQIPALVSRTQKLHCNSTALDDGDAGNGCARCNNGQPRNGWLERHQLRRLLQLRSSEPFFPRVRGLRYKGKGPNQGGLGPDAPKARSR